MKTIALLLIAVLLHGSLAAQTPAQSSGQSRAKMQQVLRKAQEKGKAVKVILNKKFDNQNEFSGQVRDISDTGFVLTDEKTRTTKKLVYEDVQQVQQRGMSKGAKILIVSGVVVGAAIGIGIAAACSAEGGPHC